jgi:hypothetical protein
LERSCLFRVFPGEHVHPETGAVPRNSVYGLVGIVPIVVGAALTLVLFGVMRNNSAVTWAGLVLASLLLGAVLTCALELSRRKPAERYRREHERLAGPRPGARLG